MDELLDMQPPHEAQSLDHTFNATGRVKVHTPVPPEDLRRASDPTNARYTPHPNTALLISMGGNGVVSLCLPTT